MANVGHHPRFSAVTSRKQLDQWRNRFVCAAGEPVSYLVEKHYDPDRIDHVWIDVDAGEYGVLRIALNTWSKRSQFAGFDDRMYVAIVTEEGWEPPSPGVELSDGQDYEQLLTGKTAEFVPMVSGDLEELFIRKAKASKIVQAWGELHVRPIAGVHQVHSRRASCAVPDDLRERDGAVNFFYPDRRADLVLLKFCGQ